MRGVCPNCSKEFENLGVHQRFCKELEPGACIPVDDLRTIFIDEITEKTLSSIISDIEAVLKSLQHTMKIEITKNNGNVSEVELTARFQIRR